jgi:hypothetical protein
MSIFYPCTKILRMQKFDKQALFTTVKEIIHCTYACEGKTFRIISDWLIPSLHQLFTCLVAKVRYLSDIL